MRRAVTLAVYSLLWIATACKTVPMPPPTIVPVPHRLSAQAVQIAVVAGIENRHPPATYDPRVPLSDAEFAELMGKFPFAPRQIGWFAGPLDGDCRYALVDNGESYLKVCVRIQPEALRLEIVESRGLLQENGRIHKTVPDWLGNLSTHLERELLRLDEYGSLRAPKAVGRKS